MRFFNIIRYALSLEAGRDGILKASFKRKKAMLYSFIPAFIFSAYFTYIDWQENKVLLLGSVLVYIYIYFHILLLIFIVWLLLKFFKEPRFPYIYQCGEFIRLKNVSEELLVNTEPLNQLFWEKKFDGCREADLLEYTHEEKAKLFEALNNLGFAFYCGKKWRPSVTFEEYREIGLLSGTYKEISWSWVGPGDFVINEK